MLQNDTNLVTITDRAIEKVKEFTSAENKQDAGLRVYVSGGGCSGLTYGMSLDNNVGDDDISFEASPGLKIINYPRGYKQEPMEEFIDRSLINLGIDCIDLLQLHCPPSEIISKKETFEMMDEIVKKGKIVNYGVSVNKISDAMEAIQNPNVKSSCGCGHSFKA